MHVVSSASAYDSGGKIPGRHRASIVFRCPAHPPSAGYGHHGDEPYAQFSGPSYFKSCSWLLHRQLPIGLLAARRLTFDWSGVPQPAALPGKISISSGIALPAHSPQATQCGECLSHATSTIDNAPRTGSNSPCRVNSPSSMVCASSVRRCRLLRRQQGNGISSSNWFFAHVYAWRKVDRQLFHGPGKTAVGNRSANAVTALTRRWVTLQYRQSSHC